MAALDERSDLALSATSEVPPPTVANIEKTRSSTGWFGRWDTAYRSFCVLRDLTPEQVDNFMKSYVIYSLDWKDEKMMTETLGPDYQKRVGECLRDYYSVLNHMCAMGELEKMYVPPIMDLNATITVNQDLYEESIAEELQLPPKPRLLDLGCGRGRVAAHMTRLTGARVTGINIDFDQVASAKAFNEQMGYNNEFIRMDFNDLPLPLPDNEFDGFYNIQAFSLCKDIPAMCRELYRVLKPGARLSLLDWVKLEAFNDEDPHHQDLMRMIKPLIGAVGTPTPESMAADIASAGFKVLEHSNASIDGLQAPLIERAEWTFRYARYGLLGGVALGLLPAHFKVLMERFARDGEAFIEADKARLITTSYHWLAVKPKDDEPSQSSNGTGVESDVSAASSKLTSATSSHKSPQSSATSSEYGTKSPSPANSELNGFAKPPSAAQ